jgi:hypothetical protein
MCRWLRTAAPSLCLAVIAACAAPKAVTPPPAPVLAPGVELPAPAEQMEYSQVVKEDPAVSGATTVLAKAAPAARPAALMNRARVAFAAAARIRAEKGGPIGFVGWSPDRERFVAFCELALRDLDEILLAYPQSPEAPEAMFTVGQIEDYPNFNRFDDALETYHRTVEHYPGTTWALKAGERIRVIGDILDSGKGSPHEGAVPGPER